MSLITEAAFNAIDTLHKNSLWITISQLTEWLSTQEAFKNVDVYAFISKFLSFLTYNQALVAHK